MSLLAADVADGFDDELAGSGTEGGLVALGALGSVDGQICRFRAFGGGAADGYCVRVADNVVGSSNDTDRRVFVVSAGRVRGAARTVEAVVEIQTGPDCALTVEQDLVISGNPKILGAQGCAHSNTDLDIPGNPSFDTEPTASGVMTISGNPTIAGSTLGSGAEKAAYAADHSARPVVAIPTVNPLAFGPAMTNLAAEVAALASGLRLDADCRVYQGGPWTCAAGAPYCTGGAIVADLTGGGTYNGWSCSSDPASSPPAFWKVSGNAAADGAFFVEGWVNVSGNPGSPASPWRATLIAMNTIDISGNPTMAPFTTAGKLRNILLVSGNDIGMSGNLGAADVPGAVFAHQQLKNNGNITLNGFLMSEGGKTTG